jgi:hypothetical protein
MMKQHDYRMTYFVNFTREQGDISLAKYHRDGILAAQRAR